MGNSMVVVVVVVGGFCLVWSDVSRAVLHGVANWGLNGVKRKEKVCVCS